VTAGGYSDFLTFEPDGDVVWTTSEGIPHTFTPTGMGGFIVPTTLHGTFPLAGGIYTYRNKNGLVHRFDSTGKLSEIRDRYGNKLLVAYDASSHITTVTEFHNPARRLTFTYTGNQITAIADFTGRAWNYSYVTMTNSQTSWPSNSWLK
jgi:hypothetical protein